MIVDSSALPEQVVSMLLSAFNSAANAAQHYVLYVQEDIAESLLTMLQGAMAQCDRRPCY